MVPMPLEDCWRFFSDPRNLKKITPPAMNFVIKSALPPAVYPGLMIEYTVAPLLGIPLTWLTEIVQVDAPHRFVDEQRVGPYRIWHHEHFFRALPEGGTEVRDLVTYVPPFGPLAGFSTGSSSGGNWSTSSITGAASSARRWWSSRGLTPWSKPLYLTFSPTRKGSAFGTQRYQSHHRSDEEKRPLRFRDGEGRLPPEAAKGRGRTNHFRRAGPPADRSRCPPRRRVAGGPALRRAASPEQREQGNYVADGRDILSRRPRRNRRRSSMSGRR